MFFSLTVNIFKLLSKKKKYLLLFVNVATIFLTTLDFLFYFFIRLLSTFFMAKKKLTLKISLLTWIHIIGFLLWFF